MIESRLDELGWYLFEEFVQALLKAALGAGIESWGGRGDYGRDCYCPTPLRFPEGALASEGPFVFQVKFVSGANAAGATFFRELKRAVTLEVARIRSKQEAKLWLHARHYVLVTNCPLSGGKRNEIESLLVSAAIAAHVHIMCGKDLTGLSANHPNVRKAFPQLLGLGDLEQLILNATNKELLERSRTALQTAQALAPVFVPTAAYDKAWAVLAKHGFAVLQGPPEMGKTAIALTIGALKYADGWEVVECGSPEDMFRAFDGSRPQLFIADDAFGRTEYDPSLGKRWERDLHKLLRRVDGNHWLVWTSRKHILERALRNLDLQGSARGFPHPGAVLVDASVLTISEKTKMLFRHARHAELVGDLKQIIRTNGRSIVKHKHFTPERIRRFVSDALPRIRSTHMNAGPSATEIALAISFEISNPTDGMRKSFAALSISHKTLLFAMLEARSKYLIDVQHAFARLSNRNEHCPPVENLLEELSHSFIRVDEPWLGSRRRCDWMHPSVRDLVIDVLSLSAVDRRRFLKDGSLNVVRLALSEEGGSAGERLRPLLRDEADWQELTHTCAKLIGCLGAGQLQHLFDILASTQAKKLGADLPCFTQLIHALGAATTARWDVDPSVRQVEIYQAIGKLTVRAKPLPPMPNPQPLWDVAIAGARDALAEEFDFERMAAVTKLLSVVRAIATFEPRLLLQVGFPDQYDDLMSDVQEAYANNAPTGDDDRGYGFIVEAVDELQLSRKVPLLAELCKVLLPRYERALRKIDRKYRERVPEDDGHQRFREPDHFPDWMITAVLKDL